MNPKIFIGPMSKNIVDSIIQVVNEGDMAIGMIPSRRQVEYNGGYVNNWKTNEFINYVRRKTDRVLLERDHGGPMQGYKNDDGLESYKEDSLCGFDIIHVDPFKKYSDIDMAAQYTIGNIIFCNHYNNNCYYEVGTEEGIRKYSHEELDEFLNILYKQLGPLFERIKFAVIQSGTKLQSGKNISKIDKRNLFNTGEATFQPIKPKDFFTKVKQDMIDTLEAKGIKDVRLDEVEFPGDTMWDIYYLYNERPITPYPSDME